MSAFQHFKNGSVIVDKKMLCSYVVVMDSVLSNNDFWCVDFLNYHKWLEEDNSKVERFLFTNNSPRFILFTSTFEEANKIIKKENQFYFWYSKEHALRLKGSYPKQEILIGEEFIPYTFFNKKRELRFKDQYLVAVLEGGQEYTRREGERTFVSILRKTYPHDIDITNL